MAAELAAVELTAVELAAVELAAPENSLRGVHVTKHDLEYPRQTIQASGSILLGADHENLKTGGMG